MSTQKRSENKTLIGRQRKLDAIEAFGGKCRDCDETRIDKLEFHHLDPSTKLYNLGSMWAHRIEDRIQEELKKCVLLCKKCHWESHRNERKHGTNREYVSYRCRCRACKDAHAAYAREWKRKMRFR